jgi:hypothetical protein
MGLIDNILLFFGLRRGTGSSDRGVYYYVRCDRCKESIRFRVDPLWDLGQADGGGFTVTKHVMGQKCFRTIEIDLTFDDHRVETERSITGGKFITAEEYDAEHAASPETPA